MQSTHTEHYNGYTIAANPVQTIHRRFLSIFAIYHGRNVGSPLAHYHGGADQDFSTELQATTRAFSFARQWIDAQQVRRIH